jgi:hypothetical protein
MHVNVSWSLQAKEDICEAEFQVGLLSVSRDRDISQQTFIPISSSRNFFLSIHGLGGEKQRNEHGGYLWEIDNARNSP